MTARQLREKYIEFFESKGHRRFPSGSLVPIDVTGKLDESLLFNGAGMIQFKPYFRGIAKPDHSRLVTCQKCVRTGDIEEVGDDTHLTFFEMLGNFSFGDYFKLEAIEYSWEFLTDPKWLGLDPARLSFTVFEDDDEAFNKWKSVGAAHVMRLGEETNYWPAGAFSKGPPGPCGPNSEMFYWVPSDEAPPTGEYSREAWLQDEGAGKWVEIWNDVFIQYEWQGTPLAKGYEKTGMPDLPFKSIDTGMGLDRTAFVLGGFKNVYETDIFEPIFRAIDIVAGSSRSWVSPTVSVGSGPEMVPLGANAEGGTVGGSTEGGAPCAPQVEGVPGVVRARRIIADHVRTASFCIADGILPSNNGRGYVLRRLIRRAVLQGERTLGIKDPFFYRIFDGVLEAMGSAYPELSERREIIVETLKNEEDLFRRTLHRGLGILLEEIKEIGTKWTTDTTETIPGDLAFKLYGTFGFPLEVTQEIAAEHDLDVDLDGYEAALKADQALSRGAQGETSAYAGVNIAEERATEDAPATTEFLGYSAQIGTGKIVRIRPGAGKSLVALDRTPFYAESGGQTFDTGKLGDLKVVGVTKSNGVFWHEVEGEPTLGATVQAEVDADRRARVQRNHTATHLLQAALRQVLGTHVTQAGSAVGPDSLRFDFTHGAAMTEAQKAEVEKIVNEQALRNETVVTYADIPIAEAKARGAMALFGEKYGDKVRMVEIGEFSRELCGGTHVRTAAEIGLFKIISEASVASGVRRIEAITGEAAITWVNEESARLRESAELLKTKPRDLVPALAKALESLKDERKRREKAELAAHSGGGKGGANQAEIVGKFELWVQNFQELDPKLAMQAIENAAAGRPNQITVGATQSEGKIQFFAKVGLEAQAQGAHAANLLREIAKIAGGSGGGRADYANAGGRLPEKIDEALAAAREILKKL